MKRLNLKKVKIISIINIILLSFLFHFMYQWFPCFFTSIFFPVNESIWEHMKLIFTSCIVGGLIEYIILYKYNVKYNNFIFSLFFYSFTIIPIFLIIFLPFFNSIGENMFLNISIMIISIIISQIISYYILKYKKINLEIISFILIIICFIILGYLTYNPIKEQLFYDTTKEKYGLNDYSV